MPGTRTCLALLLDSRGVTELLLQLRVKAIGIIEDINWSLDRGLNVITGEPYSRLCEEIDLESYNPKIPNGKNKRREVGSTTMDKAQKSTIIIPGIKDYRTYSIFPTFGKQQDLVRIEVNSPTRQKG